MRSTTRRNIIGTVLLLGSVVLWGECFAQSGVPLQAVEANVATAGMGDGPTPFPRPAPPKPKPTDPVTAEGFVLQHYSMPMETAFKAWSENATWWTRREADGALVFHDCAARARIKTIGMDAASAAVIIGMEEQMSADLTTALGPWKEAFRASITEEERAMMLASNGDAAPLPIAEINARWQRIVAYHVEEIVAALPITAPGDGGCTTGRCDCKACPKKHTCDCQYYRTGMDDCAATSRDNCNVDSPPDPQRDAAPTLTVR